ncbi:outer membrane protein assembly factor BamB family protein [Rhodopirellula baltica]|uniref:Serine/threonine protein kinase n=1 Tax=Rhodopirellula baltica SWK14 TaxID=993516 RepID=L7C5K6_RHOBT|nr:PQQ-binding-like beta-propeller repeat protein [Rhodopirellula baltica]ELP29459.1 serine/threonine protein kinase [Rhodopirellula baltica SWK14]
MERNGDRMKKLSLAGIAFLLLACNNSWAQTPTFSETDWPWWRGAGRQGHAVGEQMPPTQWSDSTDAKQNIVWKVPLTDRGHGSPILLGDRVYLQVADKARDSQFLVCLSRDSGKLVWEAVVHKGDFDAIDKREPNTKASWASCTPATDGERVFVNFYFDKAVYTSAVSLDGELLWQQKLCRYQIHQGYGSSPTIHGNLVIASADNKAGGQVVGMDRVTGEVVWRHQRPEKPNYASPVVLSIAGKDQLILTGCDLVTSLDPMTGKVNWEIEGATTECVTTTVTDGKHVFSSGGYPDNHISAVVADGSGEVAWEVGTRVYVPSMLEKDGHLFMTLDAGVAMCVDCKTGDTKWKARLGGDFTSSPVLVNDRIYAVNEEGKCYIFRADPEQFESIGENQLGDSVMSTPTISGGRIYLRVGVQEGGKRQEYLYCIGE